MLARRAAQNGRRCVPVVWRGDDECIDVLVVEDAPEILHRFRRTFAFRKGRLLRACHPAVVDVREVSDFDIGDLLERFYMVHATPETHHAYQQFFPGTFWRLRPRHQWSGRESEAKDGGPFDEVTASLMRVHKCLGRAQSNESSNFVER